MRLIAVVLGTPESRSHFREVMKLFDYGFAHYKAIVLAKESQKVKTIPIEKGTQDSVVVVVDKPVIVVTAKTNDDEITPIIDMSKILKAPIKRGQKVGIYKVMKNDKELMRANLIAVTDIPKASPFHLMKKVLKEVFDVQ